VRMESGSYMGWYFVTAAGQRARPALCMKARLADAELGDHTSFSEVQEFYQASEGEV
jgi:hypothetical protein